MLPNGKIGFFVGRLMESMVYRTEQITPADGYLEYSGSSLELPASQTPATANRGGEGEGH